MREFWADKTNRIAVLLTVGLLLFIAHYADQPLLEQVPLFQIGMVIIWFTVGFLILNRWKEVKISGLGPKYIWIPLAVISGSAVLRLLVQPDSKTLASAFLMASMFGLYVVARQYGEKALKFFMPVVVVGAVSVIVQALVSPEYSGNAGLFNNYATAAQFLVFGWLVSPRRHQWWLAALVVVALFFSAAPEAVLYVAGIGVYLLIRRDWSVRILVPAGALGLVLLICTATGLTQTLWQRSFILADTGYTALTNDELTPEEKDEMMDEALNGRWYHGWAIQRPIAPLGYGVELTYHSTMTPHNIVLLVADQLGPVAALAWMGCMVIGIRKTRWKYGFLALILFGVFQPFVWTEMAPYMWTMAGAATTSVRSSYIFKEQL